MHHHQPQAMDATMETICSKLVSLVCSLSWSDIAFIFCIYVFYDALRTVRRISRLQKGAKTISTPGTTRNRQPTQRQQQQRRPRRSDASSRQQQPIASANSHLNKATNSDQAGNRSESSDGASGLSQIRIGKSSVGALKESQDFLRSNLQKSDSKVKRYISLFSGMSPTNSSQARNAISRQAAQSLVSNELSPPKTYQIDLQEDSAVCNDVLHYNSQDHELDDHSEAVYLGDVDERDLRDTVSRPDAKLHEMNILVSKRLTGVSIQEFFETCWSETNGKTSFYETWLQSRGKTNIVIYDWEYATKDGDLRGRWCGEHYTQRRVSGKLVLDPILFVVLLYLKNLFVASQLVSYKYRRTSDLHCGSLDVEVRQVQMCRMEGNDKFVVRMRTDTRGVPFADCFQTEIRLAVTQIKANELSFDVGMLVDFLKPVA